MDNVERLVFAIQFPAQRFQLANQILKILVRIAHGLVEHLPFGGSVRLRRK